MPDIIPLEPSPRRRFPWRRRRSRRNMLRDFLPAALEIQQTPPSPLATWFNLCLVGLVASLGAWSWFGHIDVDAVATGKVQTPGRTKVVQPLQPGRVKSLHVADGTAVKTGDVILELDETEYAAARAAIVASLDGYRAEADRRRAAAVALQSETIRTDMPITWDKDVTPQARRRETLVLRADLEQLAANLSYLAEQRREKLAERDTYEADIVATRALMALTGERVGMRDQLWRDNVSSRLTLVQTLETLKQEETSLATFSGSMMQAVVSASVFEQEIAKTRASFLADNEEKLALVERQIETSVQDLIKADQQLAEMTLLAPSDGVVEALSVTTIGQVVQPGQELMQIVPAGAKLVIEAYALNTDIGFIAPGQPAVIKVDSFPFTRYGTLDGVVRSVASDAIPGIGAALQQKDPSQALSGTLTPTTAAERTQDLVFPIIVEPSVQTFRIGDQDIPLQSGMTVTVEVKTEERRAIDYILSPLIEIGSSALRER